MSVLVWTAACQEIGAGEGPGPCEPPEMCLPCDDGACDPEGEVTLLGAPAVSRLGDGRWAVARYDLERGALVLSYQSPRGALSRGVVVAPISAELLPAGILGEIAMAPRADGLFLLWPEAGRLHWAQGDEAGFEWGSYALPIEVDAVALAVDAAGDPHAVLREAGGAAIYYMRGDAGDAPAPVLEEVAGCAEPGGCGGVEAFGRALDIGLVVQGGGGPLPRVVYYDAREGALRLGARDAAGGWHSVTLDDEGDVGSFVSLALSPTKQLAVAYYDASMGALNYIGPTGKKRVIDDGVFRMPDSRRRRADMGAYVQLRFDSRGGAHLIYVNLSGPSLRYAQILGDAHVEKVDLPLEPGLWPRFFVMEGRLKGAYAAFTSGVWPGLRLFDLSIDSVTP